MIPRSKFCFKVWDIYFLMLLALCLSNCGVKEDVFYKYYNSAFEISNVVKIDEALYIQKFELSFGEYMRFSNWIAEVYGIHSREYRLTELDPACLYTWDDCIDVKGNEVLDFDHNLPVICITPALAQRYAKWYSDRVFEDMLSRRGIIDQNKQVMSKKPFTIEKYYNDSLEYIVKHRKLKYYPRFRLPTVDEWKKAYYYSRLIDGKYFKDCKTEYCKFCKDVSSAFWVEIDVCKVALERITPLIPVNAGCHAKSDDAIQNLKGNVRELSANPGYAHGGGWADRRDVVSKVDVFTYEGPDNNTGARLIFEWVKW